jgi:hypothetical protein
LLSAGLVYQDYCRNQDFRSGGPKIQDFFLKLKFLLNTGLNENDFCKIYNKISRFEDKEKMNEFTAMQKILTSTDPHLNSTESLVAHRWLQL